jgi:hypothetical protein
MYHQNYLIACKKMLPFWRNRILPSQEIQAEYELATDNLRKYLDKFIGHMPLPKYVCILCKGKNTVYS